MRKALVARAKADSAIAAIVGESVFWVERPQASALPALVFQVIDGDRPEDLDGEPSMRTTLVQASCFAAAKVQGGGGYEEAMALAEAVVEALLPEAATGGVLFWRGGTNEPRDLGEQSDTGFIFHAAVDLTVRWAKED